MLRLGTGLLTLLALATAASAESPAVGGWLTWGNGIGRHGATGGAGPFRARWSVRLDGRVTSQPVVVRGIPAPGRTTVYIGTSAGTLYAITAAGRVRWRAHFGRLSHSCGFLDGYGVTGTPTVDPAARTIYVADAFGLLHALDLAGGRERPGWPVRAVADFRHEHVFGALLGLGGSVYVPTGAFCDEPMEGKLVRVDTDSGRVTAWTAVPFALGGGGGIWGFGGAAYSARRGSIYVATGNAFRGGENDGANFREWAGYGEQLVELSPDLVVRAASHPAGINAPKDLDFSSAPVVASPRGRGALVAAVNKSGELYAWHAGGVAAGPAWRVRAASVSFVSQPAWSPRHRSFYVTTGRRLLRIAVTRSCRPRVVWSRKSLYAIGSPTVAGKLVWYGLYRDRSYLVARDATTGRVRRRYGVNGWPVAAPAVVHHSLFVGTLSGRVYGFLAR